FTGNIVHSRDGTASWEAKLQTPSSKLQRNSKHQAPRRARDVWCLELLWSLELEVWNFFPNSLADLSLAPCPVSPAHRSARHRTPVSPRPSASDRTSPRYVATVRCDATAGRCAITRASRSETSPSPSEFCGTSTPETF